jgi:hypothetical protein
LLSGLKNQEICFHLRLQRAARCNGPGLEKLFVASCPVGQPALLIFAQLIFKGASDFSKKKRNFPEGEVRHEIREPHTGKNTVNTGQLAPLNFSGCLGFKLPLSKLSMYVARLGKL